eukprot:14534375-Ditylum_brightwellii.AAC.2
MNSANVVRELAAGSISHFILDCSDANGATQYLMRPNFWTFWNVAVPVSGEKYVSRKWHHTAAQHWSEGSPWFGHGKSCLFSNVDRQMLDCKVALLQVEVCKLEISILI